MWVLLNENGYVESYALEGSLLGSVEAVEPVDLTHFEEHFMSYQMQNGTLIFDGVQAAAEQTAAAENAYRKRRLEECFPIINRGQLWYDTLSKEQLTELKNWYQAWLDGTSTQTVPEKPEWLT